MTYVSEDKNHAWGHCDAHHPVIAAIDLGTNSCRLLIASVNIATLKKTFFRTRPKPQSWKIIDSYAKIVRLGEGLYKEDKLSEHAIDRTLEALRICKKKIDMNRVFKLRSVATEACRRATNGHVLIERAMNELDLNIEIVSAQEEARLALTGCAGVLNSRIPYAVVFDIGGGSTEIIFLHVYEDGKQRPGYPIKFEVIDSVSIPYGVVTVSEMYGQFASSPEIHKDVREIVRTAINVFTQKHHIVDLIQQQKLQMVGSSGTVTTLAAVKMGLQRYERKYIDGAYFYIDDIHTIIAEILSQKTSHPCLTGGRSDLVIVGSAILQGICDAIPTKMLRVADRGVREGILSELLFDII